MIDVRLQGYEFFAAALVGVRRQIECVTRGMQNKHGLKGIGWDENIEGACGECALAKGLGLYWSGSINTFKIGGDVSGLEVRTRSERWHDLIVRRDDPENSIYVLVTGKAPEYTLVGWIKGRDGKRAEYLAAHGNREQAWFVPQEALLPIETLPVKGKSNAKSNL